MSDYNQELKKLNNGKPTCLYLVYGSEDYLVGLFLNELRKIVLPDGDDGFSYKLFTVADPDVSEIGEAVNAVPFLSERTLVELKNPDLNKYKDSDRLSEILSDIPDYCTVIISLSTNNVPDKRLKLFKRIFEKAQVISFDYQSGSSLQSWIKRRFRAEGKTISTELCERLVFISGTGMSGLIPEISKISSYSNESEIKLEDIEAVAHHIPEADVYNLTDFLAEGKIKQAVDILSDLLASKEVEPISLNAFIASSFKRLYAAKIAAKHNQGWGYLKKAGIIKFDFVAEKTFYMAKKMKLSSIKHIINLCVDADFAMKGASPTECEELLKELFAKIVAEVTGKC